MRALTMDELGFVSGGFDADGSFDFDPNPSGPDGKPKPKDEPKANTKKKSDCDRIPDPALRRACQIAVPITEAIERLLDAEQESQEKWREWLGPRFPGG
jgi:hypothetical protein